MSQNSNLSGHPISYLLNLGVPSKNQSRFLPATPSVFASFNFYLYDPAVSNGRSDSRPPDHFRRWKAEEETPAPHQHVRQRAGARTFRPAQTWPGPAAKDWLQPEARPPSTLRALSIGQLENMAEPRPRLPRAPTSRRGGGASAAAGTRASVIGGGPWPGRHVRPGSFVCGSRRK